MKVIRTEVKEFNDINQVDTIYHYDHLETPSDVKEVFLDASMRGTNFGGVSIEYDNDDAFCKPSVVFDTYQAFMEGLDSVDWEDIKWISISGSQGDEKFTGAIMPRKENGIVMLHKSKKKEMTEETQKTPHL